MRNKIKSADVTSTDVGENELLRMDRRTFVKVAGTAMGAVALGTGLSKLIEPAMGAPVQLTKFVDALPIPPAATAGSNRKYRGADYYEISMNKLLHKFHRDLPAAYAHGYGGASYLGPTIVAQKGKPVVVKFTNSLPLGPHILTSAIDTTIMGSLDENGNPWTDENRVAVHLHGGKVPPEFDGGPRDWFSPAGSRQANPYTEAVDPKLTGSYTYEYSNDQPSTMLWYHDHAWAITRFNPFAGLAAAYLLRDDYENDLINGTAGQKIPGGAYEVPIVLQDKLLDPLTGAMIYPVANNPPGAAHPLWIPEYFGDTPVVNGKAYPYLEVEPRRYRFRFLNGSNARFYSIWFTDPVAGVLLPMWVIGSEQGFLPAPAMVNRLVIAPGERFDTIVDFAGKAGTILTLMNNAKAPYPGGRGGEIPQIMQFRVNLSLTGADDTTYPNALTLPSIAPTPDTPATPWREIVLSEIMDPVTGGPKEALLDGQHFTDTIASPLFTETYDSSGNPPVNVWQFINITGDAHPMHPHLVPFKILNRQPIDVARFTADWNAWVDPPNNRAGPRPSIDNYLKGAAYGPAPEETGWKDTAKAYPGEVLRIVAKFELPAGVASGDYRYVCHCHILEHEENDMMFYYAVRK